MILGKTNLSEWANIRSTRSTSGWSARGGQAATRTRSTATRAARAPAPAAAVAANLCAVAVGTETDGSIVCPSSANGIVGIKPTVGLVSRAGIIPIAHSQDTAGPMARTVRDAAILLGALDRRRSARRRHRRRPPAAPRPTTPRSSTPDGLRGARIGVARKSFGLQPATSTA